MAKSSSSDEQQPDRRTYLKLLGAGGVVATAGCLGGNGGSETNTETDTTEQSSGSDSGSDQTTETEQSSSMQGGHLRITGTTAPQSLNPFVGTDKGSYIFEEFMYDRLTDFNRDWEVVPNLAKEWESNDDFTAWTFTLVEGARFATIDQEVLAEDVKATVDLMRSEDKASGAGTSLGPVASDNPVEVEDDYRLTINLSKPYPTYPGRIGETGSFFNIVPKNVAEGRYDELSSTDFGSGPFTLDDYQQDNQYHFTANEDWFGTDADGNSLPYVDEMTAKIIPDAVSRINALSGKRVDALDSASVSFISRLKGISDASYQTFTTSNFPNMVLNTTLEKDNGDKPFAKLEVRQAMKHALDREEMVAATNGTMTIGHHDPVAPVHPDYASFDEGLEFGTTAQIEKAKGLLEQAGYGDGLELPTPIYSNDYVDRKGTVMKLFQQQMKKAGIDFDIQKVTADTWLSKYWNQDNTWYLSNWAARMSETTLARKCLGPDAPWDSGRWDDENYHKAFENFTQASSQQEFTNQFQKAQRISHLNNAWIVFGFFDLMGASNDYTQPYQAGPSINRDQFFDAGLTSDAPKGPSQ